MYIYTSSTNLITGPFHAWLGTIARLVFDESVKINKACLLRAFTGTTAKVSRPSTAQLSPAQQSSGIIARPKEKASA